MITRPARSLHKHQTVPTGMELIDILGVIVKTDSIESVEECLDVVCNGSGTSLVISMKAKTVKIYANATEIDAFFNYHLGN